MNLHDVLSDALRRATLGGIASADQIAEKFGISASWLYMACEGERNFHAHRLPEFCRMTKSDAPIEFLAAECGGVFYRLPNARTIQATTLIETLNASTGYLSATSAAMADGFVDGNEYDHINEHCHAAIAACLGLLATAEQMPSTHTHECRCTRAATLAQATSPGERDPHHGATPHRGARPASFIGRG